MNEIEPNNSIPSVVIWDMGGILYQFFTEKLITIGAGKNWPLDKIPLGPTGTVPDPHYAALDRGEMKEPDYINLLVGEFARQGIDCDPYEFIPPERPETWEVVAKVKSAGFRQMLLTNDATAWLGENWWETWHHSHFFDELVDVKTVGISKPAPEPYLACVEKIGVQPENCIFIDDMRVNCRGAEDVGMRSYWFDITDPKAALKGLRVRLGV